MREQPEPDPSGSTAQFRAFVERPAEGETLQPWEMRTSRGRFAKLALTVVGVAIVLGLIAFAVIQ
jgi:hypothetical protein